MLNVHAIGPKWVEPVLLSYYGLRQFCARRDIGYQQNRVPQFYRKNHPPRQNYDPRPITAGLGFTLLKTKPNGQAPEPPQCSSASFDTSPSRLTIMTSFRRPSPMTSSRRSTPLHSYCFARPHHYNTLPRVRTDPYPFLLRNRSSSCHAGPPRNL
jgi:hypothetical protein